jgi:hypothetical protein
LEGAPDEYRPSAIMINSPRMPFRMRRCTRQSFQEVPVGQKKKAPVSMILPIVGSLLPERLLLRLTADVPALGVPAGALLQVGEGRAPRVTFELPATERTDAALTTVLGQGAFIVMNADAREKAERLFAALDYEPEIPVSEDGRPLLRLLR